MTTFAPCPHDGCTFEAAIRDDLTVGAPNLIGGTRHQVVTSCPIHTVETTETPETGETHG